MKDIEVYKVKYKTYMYIYNTHAYTTHNTNDKSNQIQKY